MKAFLTLTKDLVDFQNKHFAEDMESIFFDDMLFKHEQISRYRKFRIVYGVAFKIIHNLLVLDKDLNMIAP